MDIIDKKIERNTGLTIEKEVETIKQYLDYLVETLNDYGEMSGRKMSSKDKRVSVLMDTVEGIETEVINISKKYNELISVMPVSGEGAPQSGDNMVQGQIYIDVLTGSAYICISDDEATGRQYAKITQ